MVSEGKMGFEGLQFVSAWPISPATETRGASKGRPMEKQQGWDVTANVLLYPNK